MPEVNIFKRRAAPIKILAFKSITDTIAIPIRGLLSSFQITYTQPPLRVLSKETSNQHTVIFLRPRGNATFESLLLKAPDQNSQDSKNIIADVVNCNLDIDNITIGPLQKACSELQGVDSDIKYILKNVKVVSYIGVGGSPDLMRLNNETSLYYIHMLQCIFTGLSVETAT